MIAELLESQVPIEVRPTVGIRNSQPAELDMMGTTYRLEAVIQILDDSVNAMYDEKGKLKDDLTSFDILSGNISGKLLDYLDLITNKLIIIYPFFEGETNHLLSRELGNSWVADFAVLAEMSALPHNRSKETFSILPGLFERFVRLSEPHTGVSLEDIQFLESTPIT
jgi:hypothetical protein